MLLQFLILISLAVAIVVAVRFLVIAGIGLVCRRFAFSSKTKGKIIGYTTSLPELVVILSSALGGVFDVGLWNIVSSNIINWALFLAAVFVYRQAKDLFNAVFIDEVVFGLVSVALPLVLFQFQIALSIRVAVVLIAVFVVYAVADHMINANDLHPHEHDEDKDEQAPIAKGLSAILAGTAIILIAGYFLGNSAGILVEQLALPAWLVGWVLGLITSIPELASFFLIYRAVKIRGKLHELADTQEALDALVASNMVNLGIILPLGMLLYTAVLVR